MSYKILSEENPEVFLSNFIKDVEVGLSAGEKYLPSKYFYDDEGSKLFDQITKLPEYYPTAAEIEVIKNHSSEISDLGNEAKINILELGAGANIKTSILLEQFTNDHDSVNYIPIDISVRAVRTLEKEINDKFGQKIIFSGVVGEYLESLKWLDENTNKKMKKLVLFLGSNIGNFSMKEAAAFLKKVAGFLHKDDYFLIGFDTKKDIKKIEHAYDDSQGVTAAFNLNLLTRINRELGANFDISEFRHYSYFDLSVGAMLSWLVSQKNQTVRILDKEYQFKAWEGIHTEFSVKYSQEDIIKLADESGFKVMNNFSTENMDFIDSLWQKI